MDGWGKSERGARPPSCVIAAQCPYQRGRGKPLPYALHGKAIRGARAVPRQNDPCEPRDWQDVDPHWVTIPGRAGASPDQPMSLRVLLVANTLPPADVSGVGEQVLQLADGLRAQGCGVRVLGRSESGLGASKSLYPVTAVPRVLRAVREFRPHVIQTHESDGGLVAFSLAVTRDLQEPRPVLLSLLQVSYCREFAAVRPLDLPLSARVRPSVSERWFQWTRAPLHVLLGLLTGQAVDRVLAPSQRTLTELRDDYGIEDGFVLPNAMVENKAHAEAVDLPDDEIGFLIVGRMRVRKGIETALASLASIDPGRRPCLWLAGDGEHRAGLERAARRLGVDTHVRFLGRCTAGQVMTLMQRARALLVPSTYEGMPLVVLEAMSQGLPVVASAVSGIPEVVIGGRTGWLLPPEDVKSLTLAIESVVRNPFEAQRRGIAGRERLLSRYQPQQVAEEWLRIVRSLRGPTS